MGDGAQRWVVADDGEEQPYCAHLEELRDVVPSVDGACEDCLREGTTWVHLRVCLTCGHAGCCDASPRRHARAHWQRARHPVAQSGEPQESWAWCFPDELYLLPT